MGTHPIKFLLLNKNELSYEVLIRGEEPAATVLKLRNQINKLTITIPSEDIQESGIESEADLEGVTLSIKELITRIKSLLEKYDLNLFERTRALAHHIYHRLSRIDKTNIVEKLDRLQKEFNSQYALLVKLTPASSSLSFTEQSSSGQSLSISVPVTDTYKCERNHITDLQKLKFNGKSCVRVFIQRVNEFCTSRCISHSKLLTYATEIFTGQALHWYRSVKTEVGSWQDLTKLLIADFGQFDYDYRLISEIRSRTQGDSENIIVYLAIMSELFSRLSKPMSEEEKLEILLHNIRPCYATILVSHGDSITSIETLRSLCRNYERIQALSAQFREPPRVTTETLAPDLAFTKTQETSNSKPYYYNKNSNANYNSANNSKPYYNKSANIQTATGQTSAARTTIAAINASSQGHKKLYCPRCRNDSHNLRQCKQEHFLICFKCGKKDTKYPDCTNCNSTTKGSNPKN